MVPQNYSVSHILQNIFLFVKQNKESHKGLELQTWFQKSWDTVQIVNKKGMQCESFKFQYFIQNTT